MSNKQHINFNVFKTFVETVKIFFATFEDAKIGRFFVNIPLGSPQKSKLTPHQNGQGWRKTNFLGRLKRFWPNVVLKCWRHFYNYLVLSSVNETYICLKYISKSCGYFSSIKFVEFKNRLNFGFLLSKKKQFLTTGTIKPDPLWLKYLFNPRKFCNDFSNKFLLGRIFFGRGGGGRKATTVSLPKKLSPLTIKPASVSD